jgi:hypothetical protein
LDSKKQVSQDTLWKVAMKIKKFSGLILVVPFLPTFPDVRILRISTVTDAEKQRFKCLVPNFVSVKK